MWDIILASPFLWQGQNLCWLCLALIIDWRVVSAFLHVHDEKGICVSSTCLEKMRKLAKNQAFRASNTQREGSRYCKNPRYMCRRLAVDMTLKRNFGLFLRAFSTCHCSKRGKNAPTGKRCFWGILIKGFPHIGVPGLPSSEIKLVRKRTEMFLPCSKIYICLEQKNLCFSHFR